MKRVVLDASAAVRAVLGAEDAELVLDRLEEASVVIAPDVYASEVANALWKYARDGVLGLEEARQRLARALDLVDDLLAVPELVTEALTEASRCEHPVYDLLYVVAARRHGCSLLTRDRRLLELARELGVGIA